MSVNTEHNETSEIDIDNEILDRAGIAFLFDAVDKATVEPLCKWIVKNSLRKIPLPELKLIINSGGGDVAHAFALIEMIHSSPVPVSTIGIGEIQSAALFISMSGEKGRRIITPNCTILSHQFSWEYEGKDHELWATRKGHDIISEFILKHYVKHTGLNVKKIKEILLPPQDVYLTPKEALKYGLCDKVKEIEL
jgi:ATP-dependent Clp protease protease subunit